MVPLIKQQKQGVTGAPTLTWWAPVGLGSPGGTLRGRGCGACTAATLCNFFSGEGTTRKKEGRCFFFLRVSPEKERGRRETETRDTQTQSMVREAGLRWSLSMIG